MASYYTILTSVGQAKVANAVALGQKVNLSTLAVGDANGVTPQPDANVKALVRERRRAPLNSVDAEKDNPNFIVCEQVLPPEVGGWEIREIGVFDDEGNLIAYGNYPPTYKPLMNEGTSRTQTVRLVMQVSNVAAVTLKVDPSVVLATRQYVDSTTQNLDKQLAVIAKTGKIVDAKGNLPWSRLSDVPEWITSTHDDNGTLYFRATDSTQFRIGNNKLEYLAKLGNPVYSINETGSTQQSGDIKFAGMLLSSNASISLNNNNGDQFTINEQDLAYKPKNAPTAMFQVHKDNWAYLDGELTINKNAVVKGKIVIDSADGIVEQKNGNYMFVNDHDFGFITKGKKRAVWLVHEDGRLLEGSVPLDRVSGFEEFNNNMSTSYAIGSHALFFCKVKPAFINNETYSAEYIREWVADGNPFELKGNWKCLNWSFLNFGGAMVRDLAFFRRVS